MVNSLKRRPAELSPCCEDWIHATEKRLVRAVLEHDSATKAALLPVLQAVKDGHRPCPTHRPS